MPLNFEAAMKGEKKEKATYGFLKEFAKEKIT